MISTGCRKRRRTMQPLNEPFLPQSTCRSRFSVGTLGYIMTIWISYLKKKKKTKLVKAKMGVIGYL